MQGTFEILDKDDLELMMHQILAEVRELTKVVGARFDAVDRRLDNVELRLTKVEGEVTGLRAELGELTKRRR